jgi:hypothetical protein
MACELYEGHGNWRHKNLVQEVPAQTGRQFMSDNEFTFLHVP